MPPNEDMPLWVRIKQSLEEGLKLTFLRAFPASGGARVRIKQSLEEGLKRTLAFTVWATKVRIKQSLEEGLKLSVRGKAVLAY